LRDSVRKFRSDFYPDTGSNFAAAEWYLTDQNGNGDCLFCIDKFGAQPIGFVTKSQGRSIYDPNNTSDAEQQLLRNWIRGGGLLMALFFEKLARQVLNVHAILHIVLYTERDPCPQCSNFLTDEFKKTTSALGTAVMSTFPYLGPWPSGEIGAQLDVFAWDVVRQPDESWQIPFLYGAPAGTA